MYILMAVYMVIGYYIELNGYYILLDPELLCKVRPLHIYCNKTLEVSMYIFVETAFEYVKSSSLYFAK